MTTHCIPLRKFISLDNFSTSLISFLRGRCVQVPMPTEQVIYSFGQTPVVEVARYYYTGYYLYEDRTWSYLELHKAVTDKGEKFMGTYHYDEIILVEVWEDHGDDGHVKNQFIGFRFVEASLLKEQLKALPHPYNQSLMPSCMTSSDDEWAFK
jgi:hypothetical protein